MEKLHNIYQIANAEAYKAFMQDEWQKNNLYWYSSIDRRTEYAYEDLKKKLSPTRSGNMYFRIVDNNTNGCKEVVVHRSKAEAIKDVKTYERLNVDGMDIKIFQPQRIERAEDLAITYQCNRAEFEKKLKENNYTEYELKAARAIARYGAEWHNHVEEMKPIGQDKPSFQDKVNEAKAIKAKLETERTDKSRDVSRDKTER